MGIDIERGIDRGRSGFGRDVRAREWRGCEQRRSNGDVEVHLEQRDGCDGFGWSSWRQPRRSRSRSSSGDASDRCVSFTKRHLERDSGNRGNEVGGIFILAKPDRAASNYTVTGKF